MIPFTMQDIEFYPKPSIVPRQARLWSAIGGWRGLLQGVIVGGYFSRVLAESSTGPQRLALLMPFVLGNILLGIALVALLRRLARYIWPLALLLVYLVWPAAQMSLALGALVFVAVLLLALNPPSLPKGMWPEALVVLASLALYVSTLAPTVLPADAGEFQLVSAVLGIAHPPGYALYTMLGRLFTLLPVGDVAYRVNLFGAVCGALTLAVVAGSVRRLTGSVAASLVAAGMLGLSTTFWAQSTTANIRTLTALFTALCLALLLRWGETRSPRHLVALAACFGLGVGHHSSIALLGLPFLAYVLASEPRFIVQPRRWAAPLAAMAASLVVLLYLPLRSLLGAPFDPSPIRSVAGFVRHVLALGFQGDFLRFRAWPVLSARLGVWLDILRLQFGPLLPVAALLAALPVGRKDGRALIPILGVWLINTLAAVTYRAPQTVEYLIPSYVALALLLGFGLGLVGRLASQRAPYAVLVAMLALAAAWNGAANYPSLQLLSHDTSARDEAEAVLRDAPQGALVLASWHRATPLWYLQQVEGLRTDVEVRYVYPEGSSPNEEVWLRRIREAVGRRPVIVTNRYYAYDHTPYHWQPFHSAWLVRQDAPDALPPQATAQGAAFDAGIRLLGYALVSGELAPGEAVKLVVYWRPETALERDYSTFVQLVGPNGVIGQGDILHRSREYRVGEMRVDAYRFPVLAHTPPGVYRLITGFYYTEANGWHRLLSEGRDHVTLASLHLYPAQQPAVSLHPLDQHWSDGLRLTGVDYDRGVEGQARVYLHWWQLGTTERSGERASVPLTVRLSREGQVLAQAVLPALAPGEAATVALDLPADLPAADLDLLAPEGQPIPRLGPWHRRLARPLRLTLPREPVRYVPLGGEMAYIGLDDQPSAAQPGGEVRLTPRFLTLRPLVNDYSVSIGLARPEQGWEIKSDATPARGEIPTLKWVRGWQVRDPRVLTLGAEAPVGETQIILAVYDAFTLEPLRVLDERLIPQGQGIQLDIGRVAIEQAP